MENGYCKGFLSHAQQILKNKYHQVSPGNVLQRTSNCILENYLKRQQVTKPAYIATYLPTPNAKFILYLLLNNILIPDYSRQFNRKVGSENSSTANKKVIMSIQYRLKPKLDTMYTVVFIHKNKATPGISSHR